MNTVCPFCNQNFPDVPNEYLGLTLECSTCKKTFVCQEAKACNVCGKMLAQQATKCFTCGNVLTNAQPQTVQIATQAPAYSQAPAATYTRSNSINSHRSAIEECFYDKVDGLTAWVRCFRYSTRASRKEYFSFMILSQILIGIPLLTPFMTEAIELSIASLIAWILFLLGLFLELAFLLVHIPLSIRRVHDIGLPWLAFPLMYLPIVGLGTALCPSQPGLNKYGRNPVGTTNKGYSYSILMNLLIYTGISLLIHFLTIVLVFVSLFVISRFF